MTTQELAAKEKQESQEREQQTRAGRTFVPEVDIREDDQALWLWADMPGVGQDRVNVELHENTLTLEGDVSPQDYEGLAPVFTEYNVGNFVRRFTLPHAANFDREHITARLVNGVLEVKLPKAAKAQPRRIPISVA